MANVCPTCCVRQVHIGRSLAALLEDVHTGLKEKKCMYVMYIINKYIPFRYNNIINIEAMAYNLFINIF